MPDAIDKEEVKPGEPSKTDDFVYKRDTVKTLRQIGAETQDRIKKAKKKKEEEKPVTPKISESAPDSVVAKAPEDEAKKEEISEKLPKEAKKEEEKIDHVALATKAAEDAAKRVAEETKASFKEEIERILNKDKDMLAKQEEADALIATWDKEKRLPKDYNELIQETMRISEVKYEQKAKALQQEAETARVTKEKEESTNKEALAKKQGEERLAEFNRQITTDLEEIYALKELPRPAKLDEVNNPDTQDAAARKTQEVLKFGVDLNTRLVKEGKEPVTSFNKIYFNHYKPYQAAHPAKTAEVPGADAPVAGAKNTPQGDASGKINYTQLHNETWAQTKMRLIREQARKLAGR